MKYSSFKIFAVLVLSCGAITTTASCAYTAYKGSWGAFLFVCGFGALCMTAIVLLMTSRRHLPSRNIER